MSNILLENNQIIAVYEFTLGASFMGILMCALHLFAPNIYNVYVSPEEKREKNPYYRKVGGIALVGWALTIAVSAVTRLYIPYGSDMENAELIFELMEIPLIGAIPYSLIHQQRKPWLRTTIEEIPFLILFIVYLFYSEPIIEYMAYGLALAYSITALCLTFYYGYKLYYKMLDAYSNTERRDFLWLYNIMFFIIIVACFYIINGYLHSQVVLTIYIAVTFCCWYNIYRCLIRQKPIDPMILDPDRPLEEIKNTDEIERNPTGMNNDTRVALLKKIKRQMEVERAYLDSDLNISTLSDRIGTNNRYLSYLINQTSGGNFSTFVNRYRIEYAQQLLVEKPDLSIEDVAWKSGFTSLANYHRLFKQQTGLTPRQYRETHHIK